jgi:hypothetical protein
MEHVEQERLEDARRIVPASEVECLEPIESEGVVYVIEKESVLAVPGPAVQPRLQIADDACEVRQGAQRRI